MRRHTLAERRREALHDLLLEPGVGLFDQDHSGVHPVELQVDQRLVLVRDLSQEPLPAAPHHRLEKPHELGAREVRQRTLQQRRLGRLGHPRRVERHHNPLVRLHRPRHGIHQPAIQLDRVLVSRLGREHQRLGVVAGDGRVFHRARSASSCARYSITSLRLVSLSSCASSSLEAAAIDRSTASRRSATIAFSFSAAISWRARPSSCSYSWRALASSVSRSLSATALALATISCASACAAAVRRLCSASSAAASSRSRAASASMRSSFFSRSRTAASSNGHALRRSTNSSNPNTTRVQMTRPPSTESGPALPPPASWASAPSIKT